MFNLINSYALVQREDLVLNIAVVYQRNFVCLITNAEMSAFFKNVYNDIMKMLNCFNLYVFLASEYPCMQIKGKHVSLAKHDVYQQIHRNNMAYCGCLISKNEKICGCRRACLI